MTTVSPTLLGNPAKLYSDANSKSWTYARNVWDIQSFGGALYIGMGNSSNGSGAAANPDSNPGAMTMPIYTPGVGFGTELLSSSNFDVEQIDQFRVIDFGSGGQLCMPNHDPTGSDNLIWYRRESGSWVKYARSPGTSTAVKHAYDLCLDGSNLLASTGGLGTPCWIATPGTSGTTFAECSLSAIEGYRAYSTFKIGGKSYISFAWNTNTDIEDPGYGNETYGAGLWRWDGSGTVTFTQLTFSGSPPTGVKFADIFPSLTRDFTSANMRRCLVSGTTLFYLCAQNVNDHQWNGKAAYKAPEASSSGGIGTSARIAHPVESTAVPWDIIDRSGTVYILWSHASGSDTIVSVTSSSDYSTWTENFRFVSDTFARSFEEISGVWYFGLGSQVTSIPSSVGNILAYNSNPPTTSIPTMQQAYRQRRSIA